jgi:hypothetical protein
MALGVCFLGSGVVVAAEHSKHVEIDNQVITKL